MSTIREFEITPSYYKRGDDFAHFLEHTNSVQEAIAQWGKMLETTGKQLQELAADLVGKKLEAEGLTHMAWLRGLTKEEEDLLAAKHSDVVYVNECCEEDAEDEDDEGECCGHCDCEG